MIDLSETICALASPPGSGAIAVIRLSGKDAISIAQSAFRGKKLNQQKTQTLHFGEIEKEGKVIDEVLVSLFKAPRSYTGEDLVEISCHASSYIINQILELFIARGARLAEPGEFTMRAFKNGKMDLTQAEAVADLIASESAAAHDLALKQMKGGFSIEIQKLREELIQFTALIELELDFAEEDVEFADRKDLKELVNRILKMIHGLIDSFAAGNVIKNGIPVAIVGAPNVGKSTLLNALLREDKAIVSEIAGTTRDSIEDVIKINGLDFRFIDTAGIRETKDQVEGIGIKRTYQMIEKSSLLLYLVDSTDWDVEILQANIADIQSKIKGSEKELLILFNKVDEIEDKEKQKLLKGLKSIELQKKSIFLSALKGDHLDRLRTVLFDLAEEKLPGSNQVVVSNVRHLQALRKAGESLQRVEEGLEQNISGDFLAMDIRQALYFLGEITGSIEIDRDILGTIFSQFCIGK